MHPRPSRPTSLLPGLFAVVALFAPVAGAAPDAAALHQQHRVACHGSDVYTRAERRVTSLPGLGTQVRMCEQNLGLKWFDEDVDAVVGLLNREYYRFHP